MKTTLKKQAVDPVYSQIRDILSKAREQAWWAVNETMAAAYWNIGRVVVEQEQAGVPRAYPKLEVLRRELSWIHVRDQEAENGLE